MNPDANFHATGIHARRPSTPSGELWRPTWIPRFTVEYFCPFKDAVHLSPNDDYYLVTDSEGNIGNMRFFRPIPEPQVTEPELLQENRIQCTL
jgi:hypothetical protein